MSIAGEIRKDLVSVVGRLDVLDAVLDDYDRIRQLAKELAEALDKLMAVKEAGVHGGYEAVTDAVSVAALDHYRELLGS